MTMHEQSGAPRIQTSQKLYLTPAEVCSRWCNRITEKTLANWRAKGEGPHYTKIGGRIAYPLYKLEEYERGRTRRGKSPL